MHTLFEEEALRQAIHQALRRARHVIEVQPKLQASVGVRAIKVIAISSIQIAYVIASAVLLIVCDLIL